MQSERKTQKSKGIEPAARERPSLERRTDRRIDATMPAATTSIDPVRDPLTHEVTFHTSETDTIVNVSRRGAELRCARPPGPGTRLLLQLQLPGEPVVVELVALTRWSRVELSPGGRAGEPVAAVGVEFVGGSRASVDHFDHWFTHLAHGFRGSVATPQPVG